MIEVRSAKGVEHFVAKNSGSRAGKEIIELKIVIPYLFTVDICTC